LSLSLGLLLRLLLLLNPRRVLLLHQRRLVHNIGFSVAVRLFRQTEISQGQGLKLCPIEPICFGFACAWISIALMR
jgi:hypothetical protein